MGKWTKNAAAAKARVRLQGVAAPAQAAPAQAAPAPEVPAAAAQVQVAIPVAAAQVQAVAAVPVRTMTAVHPRATPRCPDLRALHQDQKVKGHKMAPVRLRRTL